MEEEWLGGPTRRPLQVTGGHIEGVDPPTRAYKIDRPPVQIDDHAGPKLDWGGGRLCRRRLGDGWGGSEDEQGNDGDDPKRQHRLHALRSEPL